MNKVMPAICLTLTLPIALLMSGQESAINKLKRELIQCEAKTDD